MPPAFEKCRSQGGRIRTVKPSKATHMPVCFDKSGSHAGEVKRTKGAQKQRGR